MDDVVMGYSPDLVGNQGDLQKFLDCGGDVRLVTSLASGNLAGIAFRSPGAQDWTEVKLEGPAQRLFRETATSLIVQQVAQAIPEISRPSGLDEALAAATSILSPQVIVGKLANAAGQVVAHHLGLSSIAPIVGKVTEQTVGSVSIPAGVPGQALSAARIDVVLYDLRTGRLTATVRDFVVDKIDDRVDQLTRSVTRLQVSDIRDLLKRQNAHLVEPPKPTARPPEPPRPPDPDRFWGPGGIW